MRNRTSSLILALSLSVFAGGCTMSETGKRTGTGAAIGALGGAVLGVLYLIGRIMYFNGYTQDADKRAVGFLTGYIPTAVLVLGGLGGAAWSYFQ